MKQNNKGKTKRIVTLGILSALSIVFVLLIHFPIFPPAPFLEYDPADVPILMGTFLYGPFAGMLMTLVTAVIQGAIVSQQSGIYGVIMHFIATSALCATTGIVYKVLRIKGKTIIALLCGAVAMVAIMIPANLIITPHFMGVSTEVVSGMLLPAIIPFNAIKAGINCAATFIIYIPLKKIFKF